MPIYEMVLTCTLATHKEGHNCTLYYFGAQTSKQPTRKSSHVKLKIGYQTTHTQLLCVEQYLYRICSCSLGATTYPPSNINLAKTTFPQLSFCLIYRRITYLYLHRQTERLGLQNTPNWRTRKQLEESYSLVENILYKFD